MTTIKYAVNDVVYWLSPSGFKKGKVKKVLFIQDGKQTELTYYLVWDYSDKTYEGQKVKQEHIFTSYEEMLNYYKKKGF